MKANKTKLCYKLLIPIILLLIAVIAVYTYQSLVVQKSREHAYDVLADSAIEQVRAFNIALDGKYEIIEVIANSLATKESFDLSELLNVMNKVIEVSNFSSMGYADLKGKAYLNDGRSVGITDREYFSKTIKGERVIEKIQKDKLNAKSRFLISVPIRGKGGIKGIIFASYLEENFRKFLIPQSFSQAGYSYICDTKGNVILESGKSNFSIYKKNLFVELQKGSNGSEYDIKQLSSNLSDKIPGMFSYRIGAQRRYASYQPLGLNNWILFNVVPANIVDAEVQSTIRIGQVVASIVVLISIILILVIIILGVKQENMLELEKELLRIRGEEYQIAATHSGRLVFRYDIKTKKQYNQPEMAEVLGLPLILENSPDDILDKDIVEKESIEDFKMFYDEMLRGSSEGTAVVKVRIKSGESIWVRSIFTMIYSDAGAPLQTVVSLEDFSIQREKDLAYLRSKQKLDAVDRKGFVYYEFNLTKDYCEREEGNLIYSASSIVKLSLSKMIDYAVKHFVFSDDITDFAEFFSRERLIRLFSQGVTSESFEFRMIKEEGVFKWIHANVQMLQEPYSTNIKAVIMFKDIDEKKRAELLLQKQAKEDPLTGVLNRNEFARQVTELINKGNSILKHVFIMIDIDNFKQINDLHGHDAGDRLLIELVKNLQKRLRSEDLIGRLGGDEFMLCLKNIPNDEVIYKIAEQICQIMYRQLTSQVILTGSLGIAVSSRDGTTFDELYKKADTALYQAKRGGGNQYRIYGQEIYHNKSSRTVTPIDQQNERKTHNRNQQKNIFLPNCSAEENYRLIIEQTVDALIEWNVEEGTYYRSKSFEQYAMSQLTNEQFFDMYTIIPGIHSRDKKKFHGFYSQLVKTATPRVSIDVRILKKENGYVLSRITAFRFRNDNNKLKRVIVTINKIAEQKNTLL